MRTFREQGGVLVASPILASGGVDLPDCDSLILYDMPISKEISEQLYGRFQRFGRTSNLNVYAFVPVAAFGPVAIRTVGISELESVFAGER
nr:hypothetical protein [Polaromonas sp.]